MKSEWKATVTKDDLRFVELAQKHYEVFLKAEERQANSEQVAGIFRKQLFHAEQFLQRLEMGAEDD